MAPEMKTVRSVRVMGSVMAASAQDVSMSVGFLPRGEPLRERNRALAKQNQRPPLTVAGGRATNLDRKIMQIPLT